MCPPQVPQGIESAESKTQRHPQEHPLNAGMGNTFLDSRDSTKNPPQVGGTTTAERTVVDKPAKRHRFRPPHPLTPSPTRGEGEPERDCLAPPRPPSNRRRQSPGG